MSNGPENARSEDSKLLRELSTIHAGFEIPRPVADAVSLVDTSAIRGGASPERHEMVAVLIHHAVTEMSGVELSEAWHRYRQATVVELIRWDNSATQE